MITKPRIFFNLFGGGGGSAAPKPPKFQPANVPEIANLASTYDTLGYQLSDQDFLSRFPGLVALRDQNINQAAEQVTGPLDPAIENSFSTSGLASSLAAFGGPTGTVGGEGSAVRGAQAASIAQQTQAKQDYDRLQLQSLIQANPERNFGISGEDAVNLLIGNTLGENQYKYALYQSNVANQAAGANSTSQGILSALQVALSIASVAAGSDIRLKENVIEVGRSPSGLPVVEFTYKNDPDKVRYRGTTAQAVAKIKPEAVIKVGSYLFVRYDLIDVPMEVV